MLMICVAVPAQGTHVDVVTSIVASYRSSAIVLKTPQLSVIGSPFAVGALFISAMIGPMVLERIGVVTAYRRNGTPVSFGAVGLDDVEPVVEELSGWPESIENCRRIADLPSAARAYVQRIGELLEVPIELVSVGRERSQLAR